MLETKICTKCGFQKSVNDDFWKLATSKDGIASVCKSCRKVEKTNYYLRIRDDASYKNKKRLANYPSKYGVTYQDKQLALFAQGGVCAACKQKATLWHLDHCHKTSNVRGVLCQKCNQALGMVNDSVERLESLIGYLKGDRKLLFLPEVTI
jgi:hypothetical protein